MPKKKDVEVQEQMDLIDVHPENEKEIIKTARLYKKHQAARKDALTEEIKQKQKILALVKEANLKPLEGGKIRFSCDSLQICITPRDELVQVRELEDEDI